MAAFTLAFLNAYDNAPVIAQLSHQLTPRKRHDLDLAGRSNKFRQSR